MHGVVAAWPASSIAHLVVYNIVASQTLGLFFALPYAYPRLFRKDNADGLAVFARYLYELTLIVFGTIVDADDVKRAGFLGNELLKRVPALFEDFGQKPKFHYAFAHIATTLSRHGPTPYWSSFSFESRLGDLKRACLLVANNHGVAQRGADIIMESFSVRTRGSRHTGCTGPLIEWLRQDVTMGDADVADLREQLLQLELSGAELVREVVRFEGKYSAFNRDSIILLRTSAGQDEYVYVRRMCSITGMCMCMHACRSIALYI